MKKVFVLTLVAGLGYFSSYSQTATATRRVDDPNGPQKVAEIKKDNSLADEQKARLEKDRKKKTSAQTEITAEEKLKLSAEYEQNAKKTGNNKNVKGSSSTITPVKKN